MTHIKSYLMLVVCIIVASAVCLLIGWGLSSMEPYTGGPSAFMIGVSLALGAGPAFGALYWCMVVPPAVVPAKPTGWRRYRFFMWWAALAGAFVVAMTVRWGAFQWEAVGAGLTVGLFMTAAGWAFGSQRADRARAIAKDTMLMDLAGRSAKAILEIAGSEPEVPLSVTARFISKPYSAMNWLGGNIPRDADLMYFTGMADMVQVPEAVTVDDVLIPVRPEYGLFMALLRTLIAGDWVEAPTRQVVERLEEQAANMRAERLAKKL